MTDYSKSKYQNETAERAYALALDGFAEETVGTTDEYGEVYDFVVLDGRHVILRTDGQGFVDIYDEETHHAVDHARIATAWAAIVADYERWNDEAEAWDEEHTGLFVGAPAGSIIG